MKRLALILCSVLPACGHTGPPKLTPAVAGARVGLGAAGTGAELGLQLYTGQLEQRMQECEREADDAYVACMGPFARDIGPLVLEFKAAYDSAADGLAELEAAARKLDDALDGAR